jgi:hypothetical protein
MYAPTLRPFDDEDDHGRYEDHRGDRRRPRLGIISL